MMLDSGVVFKESIVAGKRCCRIALHSGVLTRSRYPERRGSPCAAPRPLLIMTDEMEQAPIMMVHRLGVGR
jgi:hypothetical protein